MNGACGDASQVPNRSVNGLFRKAGRTNASDGLPPSVKQDRRERHAPEQVVRSALGIVSRSEGNRLQPGDIDPGTFGNGFENFRVGRFRGVGRPCSAEKVDAAPMFLRLAKRKK